MNSRKENYEDNFDWWVCEYVFNKFCFNVFWIKFKILNEINRI